MAAVQWAHTNRVTVTQSPTLAGGQAGITLALAAMTATAATMESLKWTCHTRDTGVGLCEK